MDKHSQIRVPFSIMDIILSIPIVIQSFCYMRFSDFAEPFYLYLLSSGGLTDKGTELLTSVTGNSGYITVLFRQEVLHFSNFIPSKLFKKLLLTFVLVRQ